MGEVAVAMDQSAQEVEKMVEAPAQENEMEEQATDDQVSEESDGEVKAKNRHRKSNLLKKAHPLKKAHLLKTHPLKRCTYRRECTY